MKRPCLAHFRRLIPLALPFLVACQAAHGFTFTSLDGKKVDGEVLKAEGDSVTIRRDSDKREFKLPISKLDSASGEHIAEWKKANPTVLLAIEATKEAGAATGTEHYNLAIKNTGREATPALKLYYSIYMDHKEVAASSNPFAPAEQNSGSIELPSIPPGASAKASTVDMKVYNQKVTGGDLPSGKISHKLGGVVVIVCAGEHKVLRWTTPGDEKKWLDLIQAGIPEGTQLFKDLYVEEKTLEQAYRH